MVETTPQTAEAPARAEDDAPVKPTGREEPATELVEADLLVEDVSIDGMCGVY